MHKVLTFKTLTGLFPALIAAIFLLNGCGGGVKSEYVAPSVIIPPNIKAISVRAFENQTSQPTVGNKLWLAVSDEFIRDGRISFTSNEAKADGVVVGTIKQYTETPLSFDSNLVAKEYQLWIVMDLKFLDVAKNQYLWEEKNLEQKLRYFVETEPGGKTTEEAREELWDRFATDIVRRTVDGFGTVTGSSPRSIPKKTESTPENPAPDYPSTVPF